MVIIMYIYYSVFFFLPDLVHSVRKDKKSKKNNKKNKEIRIILCLEREQRAATFNKLVYKYV